MKTVEFNRDMPFYAYLDKCPDFKDEKWMIKLELTPEFGGHSWQVNLCILDNRFGEYECFRSENAVSDWHFHLCISAEITFQEAINIIMEERTHQGSYQGITLSNFLCVYDARWIDGDDKEPGYILDFRDPDIMERLTELAFKL